MNKKTVSGSACRPILCVLLLACGAAAQEHAVVLEVQTEDRLIYVDDSPGASQVAFTPGPVAVNVSATPRNHYTNVILADITAINGTPVKGLMTARGNGIQVTPTPNPGQAIGDVVRGGYWQFGLEFLKTDGTAFGSIFAVGFLPGPGAPGSPGGNGNIAVVGGTGAFLGARGSITALGCTACRSASIAEDPSLRRVNGGGRSTLLIQLFPMFRPEVLVGPSGPVMLHTDYGAITPDKPARPGETLILYAQGLGPTAPSVRPGALYPNEPFAVVTSPVEVLVNGKPSPAISQVGLPGTSDIYHVAFRVPDDTTAGTASVQVSAAWVTGAAVAIPVR
jgi:hypothetical protein